MSGRTARRGNQAANGTGNSETVALAAAIAAEDQIAAEAAGIRGDAVEITPALFLELWPLLRKPIHAGHIKAVGVVTGKPYESTGIRSVQVQIDRMHNVLTPLWWRHRSVYSEGGKVCEVTVTVGNPGGPVLAEETSMGGVDRGSTLGNVYKGSFTNAAKLAFARIGPGHEVYVGATDLDPDVHTQTANLQAQPAATTGTFTPDATITRERASQLVDAVWVWELQSQLPLALAHVTGDDPGDVSTRPAATKALMGLTGTQSVRVESWINRKAAEKAAPTTETGSDE